MQTMPYNDKYYTDPAKITISRLFLFENKVLLHADKCHYNVEILMDIVILDHSI